MNPPWWIFQIYYLWEGFQSFLRGYDIFCLFVFLISVKTTFLVFLIRITKIVLKNLRKKCITDSLNVLYDPFNKSLMTMLFDLFLATQLETIFSVLYCFESTLLIQNITFEWVASHKPFEIWISIWNFQILIFQLFQWHEGI